MKKQFLIIAVLALCVSGVLVIACSDSACTSGRQTSCVCADGTSGLQQCQDDGSYGTCQCELGTGGGGTGTSTSTTGGSTSATGGSGGSMCGADETLCGSDCVDLNTNAQHCGSCSNACPAGTSGCANGACTCPNNEKFCGGQCISVQTDTANCGGCDHDCQGSSCSSGLCEVETIAGEAGSGGAGGSGGAAGNDYVDEPYALAVDSSYVYWVSGGAITTGLRVMRQSLAGGAAEQLESPTNVKEPRALVLTSGRLLWANSGTAGQSDASIWQLTGHDQATPGTPAAFVSGQTAGITGLAVGGDFMFWTNKAADKVWKAPLNDAANATAQNLAAGSQPWDIAVNATHVYWTNFGTSEVRRMATGGGSTEVVASSQGSPVGIALDANYVYWASQSAGTISRKGTGGGMVEVIASGQSSPAFLVVDGGRVYWTNYDNGTVMRAPVTGGDSVILAAGQSQPYDIVTAGNYVYWTNLAGDSIRRVAK